MNEKHPKPHSHPNIRMIVSDVDGTLLDPQSLIPDTAAQAVREARRRGIRFTLASGRSWASMLPMIRALEIDEPLIAAGGGALVDAASGEPLVEDRFTRKALVDLVRLARRWGLGVTSFTNHQVFAEVSDATWERFSRTRTARSRAEDGRPRMLRVADVLAELPGLPTKVDFHGAGDSAADVLAAVDALPHRLEVCMFQGRLEITAPGATKGEKLARLAEAVGIPVENMLAIGDNLNDIPLLEAAGVSVAMGNAPVVLKQYADWVAPRNDQDGFAWAIHTLALSNGDAGWERAQ